jgi:hydroxymethylpyrimidine/phosphomethylpyrimidine kinase
MKAVLTIAGSDSGGGAGIQADLKTFEAHGVFGTSAITSITAQNTIGVSQIFDLPIDIIGAQIDAVFNDISVAAVKIGMLSTARIIDCVAERLARHATEIPIVLDPVMVSSSGDRLLKPDAVATLVRRLAPRAMLLTPNLAEAGVLSGMSITSARASMISARAIFRMTGTPILIKGGDPAGEPGDWSDDILFDGRTFHRFRAPRIGTVSCHGTGCTLASAIAANLAHGHWLHEAIRKSKDYVHSAISHAPAIGHGSPPLRHSV